MKRLLCVFALAALVLVPDWVSACWPQRGAPAYYEAPAYYAAPAYYQPVYCEPLYLPLPPCPPAMAPAMPPPRIVPGNSQSDSSRTKATQPVARPQPAPPTRAPQVEQVRPAANVEPAAPAPKWNEPKEKPAAVQPKADEPTIPAVVIPVAPGGGAKPASLEIPKGTADAKLPPLVLPKEPTIPVPGVELPKVPADNPGAAQTPKANPENPAVAVPVPAPSPDILTPPDSSSPKHPDGLPPLTLPPDSPVLPAPTEVEAKSSPLSGGARVKVSVFPATGSATAAGLRKVGFYNHTKRDLALTIEGKAVTLPAMTYLHAQLPPSFRWKCGGNTAATESVPADATGLDVVIRE